MPGHLDLGVIGRGVAYLLECCAFVGTHVVMARPCAGGVTILLPNPMLVVFTAVGINHILRLRQ